MVLLLAMVDGDQLQWFAEVKMGITREPRPGYLKSLLWKAQAHVEALSLASDLQ
jgi:hypothetical protein